MLKLIREQFFLLLTWLEEDHCIKTHIYIYICVCVCDTNKRKFEADSLPLIHLLKDAKA